MLAGATRGYRHHPQLARFQAQSDPLATIATFLAGIADEAQVRGYHFDASKISRQRFGGQIPETSGQLFYEWRHLKTKLQARVPLIARQLKSITTPEPHPLFRIVPGDVRAWEKR